jgi:16S rRNA (adenine1518-N6/adenine1519-N6)-dimethyltransferase
MPTKLGQNFLKDKIILEKIIAAAELTPEEVVIEVGPGEGILTERLAEKAKIVLAIEIDHILAKKLQTKFRDRPNIRIINADILSLNFPDFIARFGLAVSGYKVVANLPYYITSPILRLFLEAEIKPKELILMVQKEVAERIVAKPGKMSLLALSVQYYGLPALLFPVKNTSFDPIPAVDSAVIKIICHPQSQIPNATETKSFFRLIRAGFCAKRKTLANNLSSSLHFEKKTVENKLQKINFPANVRSQELSLDDWKKLLPLL